MKAIGELATEEYTYTGIYKLSNGQNHQEGFTMVYTANFKAGVKDIKVQVNQNQVTVILLQAGNQDGRIKQRNTLKSS